MKKTTRLYLSLAICICFVGCQKTEEGGQEDGASKEQAENVEEVHSSTEQAEGDKPVQHLKLPDITTRDKAMEVMRSTTDQLKSKEKLDALELHEVHIITYSLEKAIAYFAENFTGDQQAVAKKMAEIAEEVHLNSENSRKEQTKAALDEYYQLEEAFRKGL